MKKCLIFLLLFTFIKISAVSAQTLTIVNQTNCKLLIYSGRLNVSGVGYFFGNEPPNDSLLVSVGNTSIVFTTKRPSPMGKDTLFAAAGNPVAPYNPVASDNEYVGFKFRSLSGGGGGYISAANPYTVSGVPVGCHNGLPFTAVWTGTSDNPIVYFLP